MNRLHPTTTAPSPHPRRARTARTLRAARMIEHRRPAVAPVVPAETAAPVAPVMRFDDEPTFVGTHLSAQLVQRQWRWW